MAAKSAAQRIFFLFSSGSSKTGLNYHVMVLLASRDCSSNPSAALRVQFKDGLSGNVIRIYCYILFRDCQRNEELGFRGILSPKWYSIQLSNKSNVNYVK